MEFYTRTGHHDEALMVINDFLKSDIYVDDDIRLIRAVERERQQKTPDYKEICRRFLANQLL